MDENAVEDILKFLTENFEKYKDYRINIYGTFGPTGKTWLWDNLIKLGYDVHEVYEELKEKESSCLYLDFIYLFDVMDAVSEIHIVLNKSLPKEIYNHYKSE